jgi:hypothetical protein
MMTLILRGPHSVHGAASEAHYEQLQLIMLSGHGLKPRVRTATLAAYVNDGRWVADCPECNAGISVWPGWKPRCFGCGAVYAGAEFPAESEAIESVLVLRRHENQNWKLAQPVAELEKENVASKLPMSARSAEEP